MRSLLILEIEHGEDTDALTRWIRYIQQEFRMANMWDDPTELLNYAVKIDLPECFVLEAK